MTYAHTQSGPPVRISFGALALGLVVMAVIEPFNGPWARSVLLGGALLAGALGVVWGSMTVRVDGEQLSWHFGPGWPRYVLALRAIRSVAIARTTFWQGWGIHRTRSGWRYNIAGYDALRIDRIDGNSFLLGTDEPRKVKAAIERAIGRSDRGARRA
jgi:hypothetical protein